MRRSTLLGFTAASLFLVAGAAVLVAKDEGRLESPAAGAIVVGQPGAVPAQQSWEYEIYPVGGAGKGREVVKTFNDLGSKGWEYVGLINEGTTFLFKRPTR